MEICKSSLKLYSGPDVYLSRIQLLKRKYLLFPMTIGLVLHIRTFVCDELTFCLPRRSNRNLSTLLSISMAVSRIAQTARKHKKSDLLEDTMALFLCTPQI